MYRSTKHVHLLPAVVKLHTHDRYGRVGLSKVGLGRTSVF